jgi:REP element-mobilizing transposase RayT
MADTACLPQNDPFSLATGRIRPISETDGRERPRTQGRGLGCCRGQSRVKSKHLTLVPIRYAKEMARPLRVEFENAIYHLYARGNAGQMVFCDERDYARFLKLLGESAQRFEAAILCFVLMGNHFHLVAQTHRPNLRRWMHWLLVSYTVYFNRRHRSSGHLFQGRYKSFWCKKATIWCT